VPPSTPTRRPAPANPSSSSRPIRQSIPTIPKDEDEDDDFFAYSRNGGNSGMSIKEIMARQNGSNSSDASSKSDAAKQQSKMWGIDIDKFMD
jgi:hypothetical protein